MKKIIMIALMAIFTLTLSAKESKYAEVLFTVSMDCGGCKSKVEKNIPYEKGVRDLKVDLEKGTVWVVYQRSKTNVATLQKAIEKLDFVVKPIKQEDKK